MQDVEIESLLEDAGYTFNPASGRYDVVALGDDDEAMDQASEEVADILEIPLEDLQRWEEEQREADNADDAAS